MVTIRITGTHTCIGSNNSTMLKPDTIIKVVPDGSVPKADEVTESTAKDWVALGAAAVASGAGLQPSAIKAETPKQEQEKQESNRFNLDPANLTGVPIKLLNTMILDRLPSNEKAAFASKPYSDAAEAIKHLSRDFKAK